MNDRERKHHMAYEALNMLGLMALILYITRVWPFLVIAILGVFAATLRLLFLSPKRVVPVEPVLALPAPNPPKEPSDQDVQALAYRVIQQRITQILVAKYPDVRWVWENPRAKEDIIAGNKVYVLLNKAGGYRRGLVVIRNYHVIDVVFEIPEENQKPDMPAPTAQHLPPQNPQDPDEDETAEDEIPEDFGLIAFQWVEAHIMDLNDRVNEAIGQRKESLTISSSELPVRDSWVDICKELERNDLTGAICLEEGILIEFEQ